MLVSKRRSAAPVLASTLLMAMLAGASSMHADLAQSRNQLWRQFTPLIEGVAQLDDRFGTALTTGDFNGDGHDDLAIGVPQESVGAILRAGGVNVIYGTNNGLQATGDEIWTRDGLAVQGDPQQDGQFGTAVAAGDCDNDGYDDLAIGVPGGAGFAGGVNVLYGGASGLQTFGDQQSSQASPDVLGVAESLDQFGRALAACDFNFDGFDDLAIGVPDENVAAANGAGAVNVLYGSANGLTANETKSGPRTHQAWTAWPSKVISSGTHSLPGTSMMSLATWQSECTSRTSRPLARRMPAPPTSSTAIPGASSPREV